MLTFITVVLSLVAAALCVPVGTFVIECFAALLPRRAQRISDKGKAGRAAVLIPAHNERLVIEKTLKGLIPTLRPGDRVLVVADNCSDDTAHIARACGAEVVERQNKTQRGKGYALDFGVQHLRKSPPDVVVVLDADCDVEPRTIATLSEWVHGSGQPAQSLNLGDFDASTGVVYVVSALANRFTNLVRPLGVRRLGLPYRLMGTGMAIPWSIIDTAPLADGNLVEDTRLGVDLAIEGHLPLFCPDVRVTSRLPQTESTFNSQRARWEHGHMQTAMTQVPRLFAAACKQRRFGLLWMALDLAVPPMSLLMLIWLTVSLLSAATWLAGGGVWPLVMTGAQGAALAVSVLAGWLKYCRHEIPFKALAAVPLYIVRKLPIYGRFLFRRQKEWVRTEREPIAEGRKTEGGRLRTNA